MSNRKPTPKIKRILRKVSLNFRKNGGDYLLAIGCVGVVYGVSLIDAAAAWITGGVFGILLGVLIEIGSIKK